MVTVTGTPGPALSVGVIVYTADAVAVEGVPDIAPEALRARPVGSAGKTEAEVTAEEQVGVTVVIRVFDARFGTAG